LVENYERFLEYFSDATVSSATATSAYSLFLRREATAAESAARPVPKRTTVIGSGIGTGPDTGGTVVGVSGGSVTTRVGVLVGPTGVLVDVGVFVGVGVLVAVSVGVAVACSVAVVSTAGTCAETMLATFHPGANISAPNKTMVVNKTAKWVVEGLFIAVILLNS
jgi:hypothetical protein